MILTMYRPLCIIYLLGLFVLKSNTTQQALPIVFWHGMGDSSSGMVNLAKALNETLFGVYTHSLMIGDSTIADVKNGFCMHPDKQVEIACQKIKADRQLANGFNAIGISQGSQFLRALVQRCDGIKMKNLISVGGQHQGVYGVTACENFFCYYARRLLNTAAYHGWVQKLLVQATYWHDPINEDKYRKSSTFLADINNENVINELYKKRLQSLDNFVMIKFLNDTIVKPIESSWFGFYTPGQSVKEQSLFESKIFQEDRLGLKTMHLSGKLHFLASKGEHLQFESWSWFTNNVVDKFLAPN